MIPPAGSTTPYATDHDHPGPKPGRSYAELVGGPLDGLLLDITDWGPAVRSQ
ncbi:hypothetical protein [Streptomyces europaeiscabiei]|uniref:hypothetical protein n=1 Tax=Streptomyces europaeiscabiei TaxID=146819 RepID=UPI0038F80DFA